MSSCSSCAPAVRPCLASCLGIAVFVRRYEEFVLARRFGLDYVAYRRAVPAWLPQLHPWSPNKCDVRRTSIRPWPAISLPNVITPSSPIADSATRLWCPVPRRYVWASSPRPISGKGRPRMAVDSVVRRHGSFRAQALDTAPRSPATNLRSSGADLRRIPDVTALALAGL